MHMLLSEYNGFRHLIISSLWRSSSLINANDHCWLIKQSEKSKCLKSTERPLFQRYVDLIQPQSSYTILLIPLNSNYEVIK